MNYMRSKISHLALLVGILQGEYAVAFDNVETTENTLSSLIKPQFNNQIDHLPKVHVSMKMKGRTEMIVNLEDTFPCYELMLGFNMLSRVWGYGSYPYKVDRAVLRGLLAVISQYEIPVEPSWGAITVQGQWDLLTDLYLKNITDKDLINTFADKYRDVRQITLSSPSYGVNFYRFDAEPFQELLAERGKTLLWTVVLK